MAKEKQKEQKVGINLVALTSDFDKAYKDNLLSSNYFIHRYAKNHPYNSNENVSKDKNLLLSLLDKAVIENKNKQQENYWNNRKKRQITIMKIFIRQLQGNEKIDNDELSLIKTFNKMYRDFLSDQTTVYNKDGYLDVYRQRAIVEELQELDKWIRNAKEFTNNGKNINFYASTVQERINQEINNYIENISNDFQTFLKGRKKILTETKKQLRSLIKINNFTSAKEKKGVMISKLQCESRLKVIRQLLKANRKDILITNLTLDAGKFKYKTLRPQDIGSKSEEIFSELINSLFSNLEVNLNGNETVAKQIGASKGESTNVTVKTDVRISFLIDKLIDTNLITKEEAEEMKKINGSSSLKINFSLKNYNPKNSYDISAQSNNNFTSFLNILNNRKKGNRDVKILLEENNLSKLRYFLLNESVTGRPSSDFLIQFKNKCSELGLDVLLALDDEVDEIDFLNINQNIIPSYFLREQIEDSKNKINYNSIFSIHMKKNIPTADNNEWTKSGQKKEEGFYSINYLSNFKKYGEDLYNKMYINTKINKSFIFNLIDNISKGG